MDSYQLFRSLMTILELLAFGGIVWWAWGSARRAKFDEAAQLPFHEEDSSNVRSAVEPTTNRGRK